MLKYFDVKIEFGNVVIRRTIADAIVEKRKGSVFVIDGNVLATSVRNDFYKSILNQSLVGTCDGGSIALMASVIHRKHFSTYTGPELFSDFIHQPYKQLVLGNTEFIIGRLKEKLAISTNEISHLYTQTLPFLSVNDFDYQTIADDINKLDIDIVWVSLGAPKQEMFISRLLPYLNRGVCIAIGAAVNLFVDDEQNRRAPKWMLRLKLEWLYRAFKEPKRVGMRALRYAILLPRIFFSEVIRVYLKNKY